MSEVDIVEAPIERKQLSSWRLRSPIAQNVIASIILALTPGIYLGITQLGAGAGKTASTVVNSKVNVILYSIFTVVSICAGPLINFFGPKLCMAFGTTGYAVYVSGLWYIDVYNKPGYPLFTGAYLGVTAAFLWTSCAYISQAYGDERKKAWFIQFQLICQASGSILASAIAFGANYHKKAAGGVTGGVYGAFIAIHLVAGLMALLFIVDPKTVVRNDGTHLSTFPRPSPKEEVRGMIEAFKNPRIMCFVFAGFTFDLWIPPLGSWNGYTFGLRARGLNAMCFYFFQILGGFLIFFCAANPWIKGRRNRCFLMIYYVMLINIAGYAAWIGYLAWSNPNRHVAGPALDWTMGSRWGKAFGVYMVMGLMATSLRNVVYYMNAIASNDPAKQARYAGILHSMPQAGMAVAFGIETRKPKFLNEVIPYMILTVLSIIACWVGVKYYVTDTLYGAEDTVIVPLSDAERLGLPSSYEEKAAGTQTTIIAIESEEKSKDGPSTRVQEL